MEYTLKSSVKELRGLILKTLMYTSQKAGQGLEQIIKFQGNGIQVIRFKAMVDLATYGGQHGLFQKLMKVEQVLWESKLQCWGTLVTARKSVASTIYRQQFIIQKHQVLVALAEVHRQVRAVLVVVRAAQAHLVEAVQVVVQVPAEVHLQAVHLLQKVQAHLAHLVEVAQVVAHLLVEAAQAAHLAEVAQAVHHLVEAVRQVLHQVVVRVHHLVRVVRQARHVVALAVVLVAVVLVGVLQVAVAEAPHRAVHLAVLTYLLMVFHL